MNALKLTSVLLLGALSTHAQLLTSEDSMSVNDKKSATYIGGYGSAFYQYESIEEKATIHLERIVFFLGHRFNEKFSFLAEVEIEDAKVEGGEEGGEVAIEQAYLKFNLNRNSYLTAGLFLPRIGIINENHLPNTYNGNERPVIEQLLIPSTWRELGVAYYSQCENIPLDISLAIMNGLDCSGFEHGTLIRDGRANGQDASANNLAFTASARYTVNNLTFQVSGYTGGSCGFNSVEADSLNLDSGPLGTPVMLAEGNVVYRNNALTLKGLIAWCGIPDADRINASFANNTPESAIGFYAEAAYDLLHKNSADSKKSLHAFVRYENFDLNASIPDNGIIDPVLDQSHVIAGLTYLPIPNIAVKADVRLQTTGDQNPALIANPNPAAPPFNTNTTFVNLGFGFSF